MLTPSQKIYLSDSKIENAGRGVFAAVAIKGGETIELAPVVEVSEVPEADYPLKKTELFNYYFRWRENVVAVGMGFASLYNHSWEPNATYKKKVEEDLLEFVAIKDIAKDEEITVNYNYGDPDDKTPLWIKSIKPYEKPKENN
jgi:SET domain-containing protein